MNIKCINIKGLKTLTFNKSYKVKSLIVVKNSGWDNQKTTNNFNESKWAVITNDKGTIVTCSTKRFIEVS